MAKGMHRSLSVLLACFVAFSFIIKETFCWQTVQLASNILCSVAGAVDPHPDKPNPGGGLPGGGDTDPVPPDTPVPPDAPDDEDKPVSPVPPDETESQDNPQKPQKEPEKQPPSNGTKPREKPAGNRGKTPFTGDNSRLSVWISLLLISAAGIWSGILLLIKEKKEPPRYAKPGLYGWAFVNRNMDKIEKIKKITKKHLQNLPECDKLFRS